jgi:hypothetical protein
MSQHITNPLSCKTAPVYARPSASPHSLALPYPTRLTLTPWHQHPTLKLPPRLTAACSRMIKLSARVHVELNMLLPGTFGGRARLKPGVWPSAWVWSGLGDGEEAIAVPVLLLGHQCDHEFVLGSPDSQDYGFRPLSPSSSVWNDESGFNGCKEVCHRHLHANRPKYATFPSSFKSLNVLDSSIPYARRIATASSDVTSRGRDTGTRPTCPASSHLVSQIRRYPTPGWGQTRGRKSMRLKG